MMKRILVLLLSLVACSVYAEKKLQPTEQLHIDVRNKASLQRGARLFMNYCAGCHSLKYVRYDSMAEGIGITNQQGEVLKQLVKTNLIFTTASIIDPIKTAMASQDAKMWFGIVPPDLSLIIRVRGAPWVYTYLRSFYNDPSRPLGTNNLLFPDVAMPNVLVNLQGILKPVYKIKKEKLYDRTVKLKEVDHLELVQKGSMSQAQFDSAVNDLVNFLTYVSEPIKIKRQELGIWVLFFVILFAVFAYLLKREYWKDIKSGLTKNDEQ